LRVSPAKTKAGERLPYLLGKLKAARVLERLAQTAERARAEQWPYEQFLESLLEAEVFARDLSSRVCPAPTPSSWSIPMRLRLRPPHGRASLARVSGGLLRQRSGSSSRLHVRTVSS
jgi:hypothetical protein